jgi:hypothetical protein
MRFQRLGVFTAACLSLFGLIANFGWSAGITEVNLQLRDLVYDPVAQRLFATSVNDPTNLRSSIRSPAP